MTHPLHAPTEAPAPPVTAEDLVRQLKQLPSAPKMLPQLKRLLCDFNTDIREIVDLVRLDASITASVLRVANSAYFANSDKHVTVESAVSRLGYEQIYELVSYAVASQVLVRPLEVYGIESDYLWSRSVAVAMAAEALALDAGMDRNIAYTAGLLQSMGMVAIDEWALRHNRELRLPVEDPVGEAAVLGFDHSQAGAALLTTWGFPTEIVEPVRWQYHPESAGEHAPMASLLVLSKWVRDWLLGKTDPAPVDLLERHGFTRERVYLLVADVGKRMAMVDSMLSSGRSSGPFPRRRFSSDV